MTLVATPADPDANSYLTVEDADALAGDDLGPERDAWVRAELALKERALIRATRDIDKACRQRLAPAIDRSLIFPRTGDVDADDEPIIPRAIVLDTYQQAIFLVKNAATIAAANTRRAQGVQSASEPQMSWSASEDGPNPTLSALATGHVALIRAASRSITSVRLIAVEEDDE